MTLAFGLGIIGIPLVDSCAADARGLVACLRDMADRKFDLPGDPFPRPRAAESAPLAPLSVPTPVEPALVPIPVPAVPPSPEATTEPPPVALPPWLEDQPGEGGPMLSAEATEIATIPGSGVPRFIPMERQVAIEEVAIPTAAAPSVNEPARHEIEALVLSPITAPPPETTLANRSEPSASSPTDQANIPAAGLADTPVAVPAAVEPPSLELPASPLEQTVAASEVPPPVVAPGPPIAAPLVLAPTIDAIELEGESSYISGSGPAGAIVRLFSDGKFLGESPVEGGRWLVEAGTILDQLRTELRAEAIEPETGKSLGDSVITVEIELPDTKPKPTETVGSPAPASDAEPDQVPVQGDDKSTESVPESVPTAPTDEPAKGPEPSNAKPLLPEGKIDSPAKLPPIPSVTPNQASTSVEILPRPDAPALVAEFTLPIPPTPSPSVTVLHLFPFGDPVYGRYSGGQAIIRRGDSLWSLARRYYGAGIHYRTIFKANRDQIRRPSRIYPGQVFDLPVVTEE